MASDNITGAPEKSGAPRAKWSGKVGFILAAAASAIGLGNMWRFPYLAAKYGGGAFLITYIVLVVTFGFALMLAETSLGRMTRQSAIGAYSHFGRKFTIIGILASAVPFIITPYYSLIGGWVTKYMVSYATETADIIAGSTYFTDFIIGNTSTFLWMLLFIAAVVIIVSLGVKNGIERVNKVLMPALIIMAIAIFIYSMTLPGAVDGLKYYLIPDFSKFSVNMVVAAMGQMFFSLSLSMGIMITYGSYFQKEEDLNHSVRRIELFDTGIAILAGLMIIPAAVAVQGSAEAVAGKAGPGFMFGILPTVFGDLSGIWGNVVGFLFFALVFFAALTSCISLFETCISIIHDGAHVTRRKAILICTVFMVVVGIICNMGYNAWLNVDLMHTIFGIGAAGDAQILDFMDFISNTVLMPIVALLTCIFVGWIIKPKTITDEVWKPEDFVAKDDSTMARFHAFAARFSRGLFWVMIKFIAPIFVVLILVFYILNTMGVVAL